MNRAELLSRLSELKPWFAAQGIDRVRLFGSYARGTARADSDVDLIVDLAEPLGLAFFALQDKVSAKLGCQVDLVTEAALASDIRYTALRDAVDA
ncbi:nucleotidyltransferase family protein [soil metagenome]